MALAIHASALLGHFACDAPLLGDGFVDFLRWFVIYECVWRYRLKLLNLMFVWVPIVIWMILNFRGIWYYVSIVAIFRWCIFCWENFITFYFWLLFLIRFCRYWFSLWFESNKRKMRHFEIQFDWLIDFESNIRPMKSEFSMLKRIAGRRKRNINYPNEFDPDSAHWTMDHRSWLLFLINYRVTLCRHELGLLRHH